MVSVSRGRVWEFSDIGVSVRHGQIVVNDDYKLRVLNRIYKHFFEMVPDLYRFYNFAPWIKAYFYIIL